jgi:hypothetical protein
VNKDLVTGLFTKGDGLACEDVYLSLNGEDRIERTTFTFGEKFLLMFDDISGFQKENDFAFPGMSLYVIDAKGDTLLQAADLYVNSPGGFSETPLVLRAELTVATPMHSGNSYTLSVGIYDKKGKGTFSAKLDFNVIPDALIKVDSNVDYDEIYLFSRTHGKAVTDGETVAGDNLYMMFEGISGFAVSDGIVYPGLGLQVKDANGASIMAYEDLFEEHNVSGIPETDFKQLVSAQLSFPESMRNSQVQCEVTVWDKKGTGKVKATTSISLK